LRKRAVMERYRERDRVVKGEMDTQIGGCYWLFFLEYKSDILY
jgi:hypothetical protein